MTEYNVTLFAVASISIEANSKEEAVQLACDKFEEGKKALISSIDSEGYEAELEETL